MIGQVRAVFNDTARGQRPVMRSDDALFDPSSPVWRVHGDVVSMMVGGVAALLLQMLHPAALAGIWDHSDFRRDMLGRLRRTARFIALTTYGDRAEAESAITRVRRIHSAVAGALPDGTRYHAQDPSLLAWVHVTEAVCFLNAWQRYGAAPLDPAEADAYFADFARIPLALGADPVPRARAEAMALIERMRPELSVDVRTRTVSGLILNARQKPAMRPVQHLLNQAAIGLLPDWARAMHGLRAPIVAQGVAGIGTDGLAKALRWAFRTPG